MKLEDYIIKMMEQELEALKKSDDVLVINSHIRNLGMYLFDFKNAIED